ncbi:MAG: hypothetical protein NT02SARS_1610 [SAR86 cluster bacterium SAR86B]|uniref:Uncharacterized protein n=1 Tax=SAR86 cluster bacterium SAR86B TaxID=1123867 RepID=J4KSR3_9GAMM|nr:MAG: hypothetical protein NT02SARS_1610 [SAR86 cluster bacterium SAR86B]
MVDLINDSFTFIYNNWYDILLVLLFLLVGLIYITVHNITFIPKNKDENKKTSAEFVIETFDIDKELDFNVDSCDGNTDDLEKHETYCGGLTDGNCKLSNCCVYAFHKETNVGKCVPGDSDGPTIKDETKNMDYYYYKNKEFKITL